MGGGLYQQCWVHTYFPDFSFLRVKTQKVPQSEQNNDPKIILGCRLPLTLKRTLKNLSKRIGNSPKFEKLPASLQSFGFESWPLRLYPQRLFNKLLVVQTKHQTKIPKFLKTNSISWRASWISKRRFVHYFTSTDFGYIRRLVVNCFVAMRFFRC